MHQVIKSVVPMELIHQLRQVLTRGVVDIVSDKSSDRMYIWQKVYETPNKLTDDLGLIINVPHTDVPEMMPFMEQMLEVLFGDVDVVKRSSFRITQYATGMRCAAHTDADEGLGHSLGLLFILNDDFTGGVFELSGKPIHLELGDLLLFNICEVHEVTTVTSGTRYAAFDFFNVVL